MPGIRIQQANDDERGLPVFSELAQRMEAVRDKAFALFRQRGGEAGRDLDDWLTAEHEVLGWPAAELKERNGTFEVDVTLPGFTEKEVEVTATPSEVIVHAATRSEQSGGDATVMWSEFRSNDVFRRFPLPEAVAVDRVSAELRHGILHIIAPKAVAERAVAATEREVEVRSAPAGVADSADATVAAAPASETAGGGAPSNRPPVTPAPAW